MVEETATLFRYLLVLRFAVLNLVGFGLLGAAYLQGWLEALSFGMTRTMSFGIFAVFLFGLVACLLKIWRISVELNAVRAGISSAGSRAGKYLEQVAGQSVESRSILAGLLRLRLASYINMVRFSSNTLVFLGLIGTVIGFIIALSGVDPTSSQNIDNIAPMVSTLISGMSVALYTTLIGAVLHIWLMINYRILATGTMHLYNAIIERGESHARG